MKKSIVFLLVISILISVCGCKSAPTGLSSGKNIQKEFKEDTDGVFLNSQLDFYAKLFKNVSKEKSKENILISPFSISISLAMATNGADGETRMQMEKLISKELVANDINEYISALTSGEKEELKIANSIWLRDDKDRLSVSDEFLQTNERYFLSDVFKAPFDNSTKNDINVWIKDKTDGKINKAVEEISEDAVIYLINALSFDARWQKEYERKDVRNGEFSNAFGEKKSVKMMHGMESSYIETEGAIGFKKYYKGGNYSFVALLPDNDTDSFIQSLDGKKLSDIMKVQSASVITQVPRFSYEYSEKMNDVLKEMGMTDAFDSEKADFSKMATSSRGNIYISEVLHKTFISVDELGTKAGAVTVIEASDEAALEVLEPKYVKLDRPFVYMIIDEKTKLPIFMGSVNDID